MAEPDQLAKRCLASEEWRWLEQTIFLPMIRKAEAEAIKQLNGGDWDKAKTQATTADAIKQAMRQVHTLGMVPFLLMTTSRVSREPAQSK